MCAVRGMIGSQVYSVVRWLLGCRLVGLLVVLIVPLFLSFLAMPGLCCIPLVTPTGVRVAPGLSMHSLDMHSLDMHSLDMHSLDMHSLDMHALHMHALDMHSLDMHALHMHALDMHSLDMRRRMSSPL